MKKRLFAVAVILSVAFLLFGCASGGAKKEMAASGDPDVDAINQLFADYVKYWKAGDIDNFMTLFHENATITWGTQYKEGSKAEYKPEAKDQMAMYSVIAFDNIKVKVNGDKAQMNAIFKVSGFEVPVVFYLQKDGGKWYIMSNEY